MTHYRPGGLVDEEGMEVLDISSPSLSHRSKVDTPTFSPPTYDHNAPSQSYGHQESLTEIIEHIWEDKDGKQLLVYLVLRILFTFVALFTGSYSNSVGLVCLAFHAMFECVGLGVELWANAAAKFWTTSFGGFSYGYQRLEVLSGFANAVFLLFVSLFTLEHAIERIFEPPVVFSGPVMTVAVSGCILNLIGLLVAQNTRSEGKKALQGEVLWVRLVADNLAALGVILSAFLTQYGYLEADPLVAGLISIVVVFTTFPLAKETAQILLLATPVRLIDNISTCISEVSRIDNVLHCDKTHFWTLSNGVVVGTAHVAISAEADEQVVLRKVQNIFAPYVNKLTVQVNRNDWKVPTQLRDHEFS